MGKTVMGMDRREFLEYAAKGGLVFGAGLTSFSDFARAQANDDEHFVICVELRGGLQWMVATDGRDLEQLPLDDPKVVHKLEIKDAPPTVQEYEDLVNKDFANRGQTNGKFILLPYLSDLTSSYKKGVTGLGCPYVLGFAGQGLAAHVDDIAVMRGVHMQGDFHGIANANGEIFSGLNSAETPHLAGVMATLLGQKYGPRLLDNLVFENATFSTGGVALARAPVRLDAESLGYIVANADELGDEAAATRFAKARQLADALAKAPGLSDLHRKVFDGYVGAMKDAPAVRAMLLKLKNELKAVDASLDLNIQFKTALTLLQAGLTRVITLCLGTPNGKNKVDGFGLFDAHQGTYHLASENAGTANTMRHHLNVQKAMDALAAFIKTLKTTKFGNTNKTMFDVTTVVVGTEFSRPSNFSGNEAFGGEGGTAYGSGHYWFNNNYILFGKGVKGGAWVGGNEAIRQMGHNVDMTTVGTANPADIKMTPVEFNFTGQNPAEPGEGEGEDPDDPFGGGSYVPKDLKYDRDFRPLMARDMVRTVMGAAGFDNRYGEAYADERVKNAKAIKSMIK